MDAPKPGEPLDCGHACPPAPALGEIGPIGYGFWCPPSLPAVHACYPCMDTVARLEMAQRHKDGKPYAGAYLNGKGDKLTTWTGGTLGHVLWTRNAGNAWARDLLRIGVRDLAGRYWTGTARRGMYASLRPSKGPRKGA